MKRRRAAGGGSDDDVRPPPAERREPARRRASDAASKAIDSFAVGDWLAPPFMQNQLQALRGNYEGRVKQLGRKPIVAIADRPDDVENQASSSSAKRSRGASARAAQAAEEAEEAAAGEGEEGGAGGEKDQEREKEKEKGRRRRRRAAQKSAQSAKCGGVSDGKYDLQCFRCFQRPCAAHTSFVYVAEMMRFYCERCFTHAGGENS